MGKSVLPWKWEGVMVKLVAVLMDAESNSYMLKEIFINPARVLWLREDKYAKNLLERGRLPADLNKGHIFTKIGLGGEGDSYIVVGSPQTISEKLNQGRTLLKG